VPAGDGRTPARQPLSAGRRIGLAIGVLLIVLYVVVIVAVVLDRPGLLDVRLLALGFFAPMGALGTGMTISALRRASDWRPPGRLDGIRRSVAAIGVIVMVLAIFDVAANALEYDSTFHLRIFAIPVFLVGLLIWWLAIRVGR